MLGQGYQLLTPTHFREETHEVKRCEVGFEYQPCEVQSSENLDVNQPPNEGTDWVNLDSVVGMQHTLRMQQAEERRKEKQQKQQQQKKERRKKKQQQQ